MRTNKKKGGMTKKKITELSDIQRIDMANRGESLDELKNDPDWNVRATAMEALKNKEQRNDE